MNLTTQQIKENEKYFQQVINVLGEGGVFGWKSTAEVCIKRTFRQPEKLQLRPGNLYSCQEAQQGFCCSAKSPELAA